MVAVQLHVWTLLLLYIACSQVTGARVRRRAIAQAQGKRMSVEAQVATEPAALLKLASRSAKKLEGVCGDLPADLEGVIKGNGKIHSKSGDPYTLQKCLGAGQYGQAWSVQLPAGPVAVMKILTGGNFSKLASELRAECEFATQAMKHVKSLPGDGVHITNCIEYGEMPVGANKLPLPFVIFERAEGQELERLLRDSKMEPDLRTVLPNTSTVFLRIKQLQEFTEALAKVDEDGFRLFHADLHPGNIFIVPPPGHLTAIDYGLVFACCVKGMEETCAKRAYHGSYETCGREYENQLLAMNTLLFLIKIDGKEMQDAMFDFVEALETVVMGGEVNVQDLVRGEFRDECVMGSPCARALHSAARIMVFHEHDLNLGTLQKIIEEHH